MAFQEAEGREVVVKRDKPTGESNILKFGYHVACAVTIYNVSRNLTIDAYSQSRNRGRFLRKMYPSKLESSL